VNERSARGVWVAGGGTVLGHGVGRAAGGWLAGRGWWGFGVGLSLSAVLMHLDPAGGAYADGWCGGPGLGGGGFAVAVVGFAIAIICAWRRKRALRGGAGAMRRTRRSAPGFLSRMGIFFLTRVCAIVSEPRPERRSR